MKLAWKQNGIDTLELFINRKYAGSVHYVPHQGCYVAVADGIQPMGFHDRTNERAKAYLVKAIAEGGAR